MKRCARRGYEGIGPIEQSVAIQQTDGSEVRDGHLDCLPFTEILRWGSDLADQFRDRHLDRMQVDHRVQDRPLDHMVLAGRREFTEPGATTLIVHGKYPFLCQPRGRSNRRPGHLKFQTGGP